MDNSLNLSSSSLSGTTLSAEEKAEADGRSVYVGNVLALLNLEQLKENCRSITAAQRKS